MKKGLVRNKSLRVILPCPQAAQPSKTTGSMMVEVLLSSARTNASKERP